MCDHCSMHQEIGEAPPNSRFESPVSQKLFDEIKKRHATPYAKPLWGDVDTLIEWVSVLERAALKGNKARA